jgi:magnesium-transporting ATPase (P-type)
MGGREEGPAFLQTHHSDDVDETSDASPTHEPEGPLGEPRGDTEPAWHSLDPDPVLVGLESDREEGLTSDEADARLERYGPNRLAEEEGESALLRFLKQFHNVLIYILIVAAIFTAILQEWIDTGVILLVVLVNAIIGFVQEGKAEEAMEGIRKLLSLEATVVRDGHRMTIPAEDLVPGDVVRLESGDRVPADIRVLEARNARVEEAVLTGESSPVTKSVDAVDAKSLVGDRRSMAFSGTLVVSGRITGVVVRTGARTEIGQIGEMVSAVEGVTTPLLRKVDRFGTQLSVIIVVAALAVFGYGLLVRGIAATEIFMSVVALAVAAIPEGLPAILTITLALGVQRMARRNAIIRRLPAVETLGAVTVICTDKTGTLTRNEMAVERVLLADRDWQVTGSGYLPEGTFHRVEPGASRDGTSNGRDEGAGDDPTDDTPLMELVRVGLLCNESELDGTELQGDPTEGALLVLGAKAGLDGDDEEEAYRRTDLLPFESERRWMATEHETPEGGRQIFVKGAPERLVRMCSGVRTGDGEVGDLDAEEWLERMEAVAAEGYRILALAVRDAASGGGDSRSDGGGDELTEERVGSDLTLLGMVALMDPPRAEATESVEHCREAGIRVMMITGDHAATARSIGARMGIGDGTRALTGQDIEGFSDDELRATLGDHQVIARASPEHKLRIVRQLQEGREICAMTGDGVNDAPALKQADIGVAMGIKGSEAAKSASEMVLADDNFSSIERAVEEGRTVYDNLKKTILFILPTNGAEALLVLVAVLFALPHLPISPVQILWVNMVTAVTLALALAFEPSEEGIMQRPPRDPDEGILSRLLLQRIAYVSVLVAAGCMALFQWELARGAEPEYARTVVVNALVAAEVWYLFNCRFLWRPSVGWRALVGNRAVLVAVGLLIVFQAGFTYLPFMQTALGTEGLRPESWIPVLLVGLLLYLVVEGEKAVGRRRHGKGRPYSTERSTRS